MRWKFWKKKEKLSSSSKWKDILEEIYNYAPHSYGQSHKVSFNDTNHDLAQKLGINGQELRFGISFLEEQGLIEEKNNFPLAQINEDWSSFLVITKKGFQVILDIQKHKDNLSLQFLLFILTFAIATSGFFDILITLSADKKTLPISFEILVFSYTLIFILLLVIVCFALSKLNNRL